MEKSYKYISLFFIAILFVIVAGFYKTYFGLFPTFENVTSIQHIHGSLFLLWFVMLIVQPILIRKRKYALHRAIGKFSYFLVPIIVVSIVFISKELYDRGLTHLPKSKCIANLFVPFLQIVDFVWLYLLAITNKKNAPAHMRYMIATSLAIVGAGFRRIFILLMGITTPNAFLFGFLLTDLVLAGLIFYDIRHQRKWKPYGIALIIIGVSQLAYYIIPDTGFWQTVCGWVV